MKSIYGNDYGQIIAKNLKRIAFEHDKTQADIARDLGYSKSTVSCWMNGSRVPRMSKVDRLCEYFGVFRSDILEPYNPSRTHPFDLTNDEIAIIKAYRIAPEGIQESIKKLLDVQEKGHEKQVLESYSA